MLVRSIVLAACAAVVVMLSLTLSDSRACEQARTNLFGAVIGKFPARLEAPALRDLQDRCRGTDGLVAASAALERQGRLRDALAYAYRAAVREPRSATAWNALATAAQAAGRRGVAARAAAQAEKLSPLGQQLPSAPGRSPGGPDGGP